MDRLQILQHEVETAAHILNDLKTVHECVKDTLERTQKTSNRIGERIPVLETRIDRITADIGKLKARRQS